MRTTESGHNVSMLALPLDFTKGFGNDNSKMARKWRSEQNVWNWKSWCWSSSFKSTRSRSRCCRHNEPMLGGVRIWECHCLKSPHPDAYQPRLITVYINSHKSRHWKSTFILGTTFFFFFFRCCDYTSTTTVSRYTHKLYTTAALCKYNLLSIIVQLSVKCNVRM